jgi:hypothetical protein
MWFEVTPRCDSPSKESREISSSFSQDFSLDDLFWKCKLGKIDLQRRGFNDGV